MSARRRARIALARLRVAGIEPERFVAMVLAVTALIEEDPGSHRTKEFRTVQIAKALHRLASGTHKRWPFVDHQGRQRQTELHAFPRSSGPVLRLIGKAVEQPCEWVTEKHLAAVLELKVKRHGQGGRLSGGFWLTMPRKDRFQRIRISGKPVADVDYQQLFPRLAYARAQAPQPTGDIYDVTGDGTGRDGWKLLLNALLFTRGTLKRWPRDCSPLLPGLNLKQAVALLKEKHEPIAHLFGTGIGFELMFMESEMLIAVVTHLFESGVPALPLHDAVLVAKPHAKAAKNAMEYIFRLQTGQGRAFVKVDFGP